MAGPAPDHTFHLQGLPGPHEDLRLATRIPPFWLLPPKFRGRQFRDASSRRSPSLPVSLLPSGKASPSLGGPSVPQALGPDVCAHRPQAVEEGLKTGSPSPGRPGRAAQEQGKQSPGLRVGEGPLALPGPWLGPRGQRMAQLLGEIRLCCGLAVFWNNHRICHGPGSSPQTGPSTSVPALEPAGRPTGRPL